MNFSKLSHTECLDLLATVVTVCETVQHENWGDSSHRGRRDMAELILAEIRIKAFPDVTLGEDDVD